MTDPARGATGLRAALSTLGGPPRFLLLSSFLIPLGSFMVLPFMSVFLHERLGMGLGTVGVVLAVASLVQFSGGVVGGALADRIGLRRTMLAALVVRTAGFVGLLLALRWPPLAVGALVLTCCGAALYLPANKAYLVHGVDDEHRPAFLSAGNAALNAGMAVGPLIAGPFVLSSPGRLFVAVTALFVLVTAGHARLPEAKPQPQPQPEPQPEPGARAPGRGLLAGRRRCRSPPTRSPSTSTSTSSTTWRSTPSTGPPAGSTAWCCCSASRWSSSSSRSRPSGSGACRTPWPSRPDSRAWPPGWPCWRSAPGRHCWPGER
ncbi:hypothetical protein GCM10020295_77690 [Streptomyces cinereospinus]